MISAWGCQGSLAPLPLPPMAEDADFESNFMPPIAVAPLGSPPAQSGAAPQAERPATPSKPPMPVDLVVPGGVRVVPVTGPNTGGKVSFGAPWSPPALPMHSLAKVDPRSLQGQMVEAQDVVVLTGATNCRGAQTASLKALGLAALMAKAGMFLPVLPPAHADGPPRLLWFDQVCLIVLCVTVVS